jgi:2-amino-4-hydroxy-6-hydroxymethyldihydropteridine diphosphokinase
MRTDTTAENQDKIFIGYGTNLPLKNFSPSQALYWVVNRLSAQGLDKQKISTLWRSQAWPDPEQPPYYNAVIQVKTQFNPYKIMEVLHLIEAETGRQRDANFADKRYAPRKLDLDLISVGGLIMQGQEGLCLPHPRAHERGFVMGPLAEIEPSWVHPLLQETAENLYKCVTIGKEAYPLAREAFEV